MEHGKNVRGPSLEKGVNYVMKTWGKSPVYEQVLFDGFVSGGQAYKVPTKQLKDMAPTDYYKFTGDAGEFRGKMLYNCLVHHTTEARITFFQLAGVSETAVTVNADKPVKAPKTPKKAEAKTPTPATEEPVPVAAAAETPQERKRRLDNERKKQKRAEEKAAKEAAKASASPAPEATTEQPTEQPSEEHSETVETAAVETSEAETETETEAEPEHIGDEMPAHVAVSEETSPAAAA